MSADWWNTTRPAGDRRSDHGPRALMRLEVTAARTRARRARRGGRIVSGIRRADLRSSPP
jgi:hypothetical protein